MTKLATALKLMRIPQWAKNGFVLAPLVFSGSVDDGDAVVKSIAATLVFGFVASAVYCLNDIRDRAADARHPEKRTRPIASGAMTPHEGGLVGIACLTAAAGVGLGAGLAVEFWATIATYLAINVAYSTWLRNVALADVVVIASGFVVRVLAGTTAIDVEASSWIVLSTGLLALLLALGKRRSDLDFETEAERATLQHYTVEFIDAAIASLSAAVIAFYALFTVSDYSRERFETDHLYFTTFFVAIGVVRYLQVVMVEHRHGSPTDIALRDRPIQVIVGGWLLTFFLLTSV